MVLLQTLSDRHRQIAILNDSFRTSFVGGSIFVTAGLHAVGDDFVKLALQATRSFVRFNDDDNQEHDFGAIEVEGQKLFWKIDYYDPSMNEGSKDPANLALTRRVLTIMLADEY